MAGPEVRQFSMTGMMETPSSIDKLNMFRGKTDHLRPDRSKETSGRWPDRHGINSTSERVMDFVNPISFPFVKWIAASVCRVRVLAVILFVGGVWSFCDLWLEQRDGAARVRFLRSQSSATLAEKPEEFARIIRFEAFRSVALILLAFFLQGAAAAVSHYDIFAPGQKVKGIDDK